jgi:GTP-binding protein Era
MKPPPSADTTRAGRVALVGRPNVGKSTLLNSLVGESIAIISPHPQTTRETVRGVLTTGQTQYLLLDTPGLHAPRTQLGKRMNDAARQAARDADVVVFLVEAPRDGQGTQSYEADRAVMAELPKRPTILAINKVDRLKDKANLLPMMAAFSGGHEFAATIPLSAKRADGVSQLLGEVRALLPEQPLLFAADTLSDQPVRFFVAEFVREQVLRHVKQEVPHGVAVIVERFDESGDKPRIDVAIHVAREAHKKIVIGARGQMLKSIGSAARARVEEMLARKVHLQIWVRATPGWMDNPARLRDLGFGERQDS